jgi:carboxyl-terminal processing protease
VEICDLFLERGMIVSTRGRKGVEMESYEAAPDGDYLGFPMVVLVNKYSASASEIVAACLQDHGRAVVVGERTWGKGSVQHIIPLEAGESALRLTMATYWRPSGKNIHRLSDSKEEDEWGVRPNEGCEEKLSTEAFQQMMKDRRDRDIVRQHNGQETAPDEPVEDAQLERALKYLREAKTNGKARMAKE